jgi:RimJ/RimL family protein N-acetyltransferase
MDIQRLNQGHAAQYRELMLEAYELHPLAFSSSAAERAALPLDWWQARLREGPNPSGLVLGAWEDGKMAGVVGLSFETREKTRHKARLFGMYIPERFRRSGLGRRLVQAVLDQAKSRQAVKLVQLTVTHGNQAAQSLYEKSGFIRFGLEPFAVAVDDQFLYKVHMWRSLENDRQ